MPVLLTGSTGFVGQHFVAIQPYMDKGSELVCVDSRTAPVNPEAVVDHLQLDLTDVNAVVALFAQHRPDAVVHLAASSKVGDSGDVNVRMLENLFTAVRRTSVRPRFILAGSAAEYGDIEPDLNPATETSELRPIESYAVSKVACSTAAEAFSRETGCPVTILRFANIYGPGQIDRFIPLVMEAAYHGTDIVLNGSGAPTRQFVYVSDVCRAIWAVITTPELSGVFNIGAGPELSMRDAAQVVVTAVHDFLLRNNEMPKPVVFQLRLGHGGAMRVAVDSSKARENLWQPIVGFYDGVRRTVAHRLIREIKHGIQTARAA